MSVKFKPLFAAMLGSLMLSATAQAAYPEQAIKLVVPFTAGGPTDAVARSVAAELSKTLQQSVSVVNTPSEDGLAALNAMRQAQPDGYTFLLTNSGIRSLVNPAGQPIDLLDELEPVAVLLNFPMTVVGNNDLAVNNFSELNAYIGKRGHHLKVGDAGPGSASYVCNKALQKKFGHNLQSVSFDGLGPAMVALLGNKIDLMCAQSSSTLPQLNDKQIKIFAVTSLSRAPILPDVPTVSELGFKDFSLTVSDLVFAPKHTPQDIVLSFSKALQEATHSENFKVKMQTLGGLIPEPEAQSPAAAKSLLQP